MLHSRVVLSVVAARGSKVCIEIVGFAGWEGGGGVRNARTARLRDHLPPRGLKNRIG